MNTLGHEFTQDDAITIYRNAYTTQGVKGISEILTNDTFTGFFQEEGKSNLVSGGRYRPFTLVLFAIIWQFFGDNPFWFHLFSISSYALTCLLLFRVLRAFDFPRKQTLNIQFAFIATLVFVLHPVHTEAVANVKGADEIFSLFWSLLATWFAVGYLKNQRINSLLFCSLSLFLALMSKENSIAFLGIIPIACWFFVREQNFKQILKIFLSLGSAVFIYLVIRTSIIGFDISGSPPMEMMNNPFIKFEDGQYVSFSYAEKWSAILTGLAKYLQLLFFPHPLTSDYYPRYFRVTGFFDPSVLMAVIMNASLLGIGILGIRKRSFISFIILFFYATIFLVSNILFPIGTHISERFLFTPSLGLCLLLSYGYIRMDQKSWIHNGYGYFLMVLCIFFLWKTMDRNRAWKDDFTLFTTDVRISKESAKARNAAGGALITRSQEVSDDQLRDSMLNAALYHLSVATSIHPSYKGAHLLTGNAYTYLGRYESAVNSYEETVRIDPYYDEAYSNLVIALREAGRQAGSVENNIEKAKDFLFRSLEIDEFNYETLSLLGIAFGNEGNHEMAIEYFEKAVAVNPNIARAYVNLGQAYMNAGNEEEAQINLQKAVSIDPEILNNQKR